MEQALYRKYRSSDLDEVIGQNHIVSILKNSLKKNISHAYLFTGPRGVGKTSVARILAREINSIGKDDESFYPDIVEIDAASNRRIEEIRTLRDVVQIAPTSLKYKVYIIDEVHMLTREAFNALLKTLEEPPEYVVFILATTEVHKVPDTILSRCINLNFKLISKGDIFDHLKKIAKKEKIKIETDAIELIADQSEGSFRDAISILEQVSNFNEDVKAADVSQLIGIADKAQIDQLIAIVFDGKVAEIFKIIDDIVGYGAVPEKIIDQLSVKLRYMLTSGSIYENSKIVELLDSLGKTNSYNDQKLGLEIVLSKFATKIKPKQKSSEKKETTNNQQASVQNVETETHNEPVNIAKNVQAEDIPLAANDVWENALNIIKKNYSSLYGIARMGEAEYSDDSIILKFKFKFHLKQMSLEKNKNIISQIFKDLGIKKFDLELSEKQENIQKIEKHEEPNEDSLNSISNIFGSAEVLES